MLLRLLPTPTPAQPTPPTILFTLPMPSHPYTSRSLPLPANLLAHRSICLQEEIECSSVLLGEKSSWIGGIIDNVTFSLPLGQVTVHFIDGTSLDLALTPEATRQLLRVVNEVQLSFGPTTLPEAPSRSSTSSNASSASDASTPSSPSSPSKPSNQGHRRSPSAMLLSLLSPLLPSTSQFQATPLPSPSAQPSARVHRRQARSLLVDTYRRHVLPLLKDRLPQAYLLWHSAGEMSRKLAEFEQLKVEIAKTLADAGVDRSVDQYISPLKRCQSSSTCESMDSDVDSDLTPPPVTPALSFFPSSPCSASGPLVPNPTPQSFLLSIPPVHSLPEAHRATYSPQLLRATQLASRLQAIKKLSARYEREEGKRQWLEGIEMSRAADRAVRRAFSNGIAPSGLRLHAKPLKASKLGRSWRVVDDEQEDSSEIPHPAMTFLEVMEECGCSSGVESDTEDDVSELSTQAIEQSVHLVSRIDTFTRPTIVVKSSLAHRDDQMAGIHAVSEDLVMIHSAESISDPDEWDEPPQCGRVLLPSPLITTRWDGPPSMLPRQSKRLEVDWEEDSDRAYGGIYA